MLQRLSCCARTHTTAPHALRLVDGSDQRAARLFVRRRIQRVAQRDDTLCVPVDLGHGKGEAAEAAAAAAVVAAAAAAAAAAVAAVSRRARCARLTRCFAAGPRASATIST